MKTPIRIQSVQNDHYKHWRQCLTSKGIHKWHEFFLFGSKVILEALQTRPEICSGLLFAHGRPVREADEATLRSHVEKLGLPVYELDPELFDELDEFGTHFPLLTVRTPQLTPWNPEMAVQGLEVLAPLGDPSNLGSLIRNCAALGVTRLVLLKESASPFHPKAVRAASGALFQIEICEGPSIHELQGLAPLNLEAFFCLDFEGQPLPTHKWPKVARLLVGQEGPGIPAELAQKLQRLTIPQNPNVESLNATAAATLAVYSYRTQYPL